MDKKLTDLLPSRKKDDLIAYFSKILREEREQVLSISINVWETYRFFKRTMFPKAKLTMDNQVLQLLIHITDTIRLNIMKQNKHMYDMLRTILIKCKNIFRGNRKAKNNR